MAIKDWKKSKKFKTKFQETKWMHKTSGESLSVVYDGATWRVWTSFMGYDTELGNGFKTETLAKKYAKNWMKKH